MDEAAEVPGWYAELRRRTVASGRRARREDSVAGSAEWPVFAPPVALSDGPLGAVQAADREIARQTALRARAVAEFAATRPASNDRAQGERGAMSPERWAARPEILREVSEWAAPELSVACSISQTAAESLLERSLSLVHRLPGTLAALEAGALHPGHLYAPLEHVAPIADDAIRAEVEAFLLRWAAGRVTTPAQLGDKARREVLRRDARAATRKLARALKERGVSLHPGRVNGMAGLSIDGTVPEVRALHRALGAYADAVPDDGRSRGQKMLDCLLELVLRPGEHDLPPVQVLLTAVASLGTLVGGDEPGEIDGRPVPAELLRVLLHALGPTVPPATPAPEAAAAGPAPAGQLSAVPVGCWQQEEQDLLARWADELTDRILAGEFDEHPDWASDAESEAHDADLFLPHDGPRGASASPDTSPPDTYPPDTSPPDAGPPGTAETDSGDPDAGDPDAGPSVVGSSGGRWWADADRAVTDAGAAVRDAELALGHARRLVGTARRADATDETAWQQSSAGRITAAEDALAQLAAATEDQRRWLAGLLSATGGGGLAERPRIALTDALTGALLALTDLSGLRRTAHCGRPACRRRPEACSHELTGRPGLGPPPETDGYRPGAALDRYVRARDRRCRFPGCRRRVPNSGELDTTAATPTDRPPPRISPATAPPTTAASTRPPAGGTTSPPTAPLPSPPRAASSPSPPHRLTEGWRGHAGGGQRAGCREALPGRERP